MIDGVPIHVNRKLIGIVSMAAALSACTAVQFTYNNADALVRYMAWDYVDLDEQQSEALQQRFSRLHSWHRSSELAVYTGLVQSAENRVSKGVSRADAEWAIDELRANYRRLASRAAEEAAPILATLSPEQVRDLEKKLARDDAKYVREWLSGSASRRERHAVERTVERFEEWTGDLSRDQTSRIEQFVRAHPRIQEVRLEERHRWRREALELIRRYRKADELAPRLARLFGEPEAGRTEDYMRETRRWEGDLAALMVELDRTLSTDQRNRVLRRLRRYAEDFKALSLPRRAVSEPLPAGARS